MPSCTITTVKKSPGVLIVMIAVLLIGSACQSPGGHVDESRNGNKNILANLGRCSTRDTLLELIGQGASAAASWKLSDSLEMLTGLMRAIEQTGLKPSADAGRFDSLAIARLVKTVYRDWGITFNPCDASLGSFLPQKVYGAKKGTCLGIGLLFLLIAEKYDYPLRGVALPGHFFLRAEQGAWRRNIEPNAMGIERTDDYYRQRYGIAAGSWYYPLRNLSRKETGAVFFYMIGNLCREKGKLREAELCFKTALRLFPDYPDALGNMAIVFSSQGKSDSALLLLDRAAVLNPVDRKIWRNKGLLLLENGREKAAVDLAVERLTVTPDDTGLLYVNAVGSIRAGSYGDAAEAVRRFSEYGDTARTKALKRLLAKMKKS